MDKLLRRLGLSGRSIVPLLLGFGCSVPAIMSARTLPSKRDRYMTIILVPFMSCSAKIPIYAMFTAAFFENHKALVMFALYVMGIVVAVCCALLLKGTIFSGNPVPFVMVLPNYRMPVLKSVWLRMWENIVGFIRRAFTVIFIATIVIWLLQSFDTGFNMVENSQQSMLPASELLRCPSLPAGLWRLARRYRSYNRSFCQGSGSKHFRHTPGCSGCNGASGHDGRDFHAFNGLCLPGLLPALHALRRHVGHCKKGNGKPLEGCCRRAVPDERSLDCGLYRLQYRAVDPVNSSHNRT